MVVMAMKIFSHFNNLSILTSPAFSTALPLKATNRLKLTGGCLWEHWLLLEITKTQTLTNISSLEKYAYLELSRQHMPSLTASAAAVSIG